MSARAYFYHSEAVTPKVTCYHVEEWRTGSGPPCWKSSSEHSLIKAIKDYHRGQIFTHLQRLKGLSGFRTADNED